MWKLSESTWSHLCQSYPRPRPSPSKKANKTRRLWRAGSYQSTCHTGLHSGHHFWESTSTRTRGQQLCSTRQRPLLLLIRTKDHCFKISGILSWEASFPTPPRRWPWLPWPKQSQGHAPNLPRTGFYVGDCICRKAKPHINKQVRFISQVPEFKVKIWKCNCASIYSLFFFLQESFYLIK
jgi:hypothetical protein